MHRPKGQFRVDGTGVSGLCQKLDFEVEFAAFIGQGNKLGRAIDVGQADDHIFGFVSLNDWSTRDFQTHDMCRSVVRILVPRFPLGSSLLT